jgi:signal transduction histidine kinase
MADIIVEPVGTVILIGFILFLWREGKKRRQTAKNGWKYIFAGFLLLLFGSLLDISDEFPALSRFVILGQTPAQAFTEKIVGEALGLLLLTIGLVRWIPTVRMLERNEADLQAAHRDLQDLTGKLISAHEEERRHLARELHDDLSQRLAAMANEAGKLEQELVTSPKSVTDVIRRLRADVATLAEDVQGMSHQLHPSILEDLGLQDAIASECARFSQREGIDVHFLPEAVPDALPDDIALCLYRVMQESLRNIAKHSKAREVHVNLTGDEDAVHLHLKDSGVGFVPAQTRGKQGLGLASMEERIRLVQGRLAVRSQPGQGTAIDIRVPLRAPAAVGL